MEAVEVHPEKRHERYHMPDMHTGSRGINSTIRAHTFPCQKPIKLISSSAASTQLASAKQYSSPAMQHTQQFD
jgi:hypothetical protein